MNDSFTTIPTELEALSFLEMDPCRLIELHQAYLAGKKAPSKIPPVIGLLRAGLPEAWWADPRRPRPSVQLDTPSRKFSGQGYGEIVRCWWDAPFGLALSFSKFPELAASEPDVLLGVVPVLDGLAIVQAQAARDRGNRWMYWLEESSARNHAVHAVARALPGVPLFTMDGEQKVEQLLGQHGGFTVEEHESMGWAEWLDGKEVLPRVSRQYGQPPAGYRFGEELVLETGVRVRRLLAA